MEQADLVVFDLESLAFTPRQKLENQLVFSQNGSSIDTVIVAGEVVVAGNQVTTINEGAVRAELNERLAEITAWRWQQESRRVACGNVVCVEPCVTPSAKSASGGWWSHHQGRRRWNPSITKAGADFHREGIRANVI